MKKIILKTARHRNKDVIIIKFGCKNEIKSHLKTLKNVFWSRTLGCFYVGSSLENLRTVFNHLKGKKWPIDSLQLESFIRKKTLEEKKNSLLIKEIPDDFKIELEKFRKWLLQKRLSENTVDTYVEVTKTYIKYVLFKKANLFSTKVVEAFNYDYIFLPKTSEDLQ